MSATVHPRQIGTTIRCNYSGCGASYTCGLIRIGHTRRAAAIEGWIRGLRRRSTGSAKTGRGERANGRWDICPAHAPLERQNAEARRAAADARRAVRDARRRARDAAMRGSGGCMGDVE